MQHIVMNKYCLVYENNDMLHVALWLLSWKDSVEYVEFLKSVTINVDSTTMSKLL